MAKGRRPSGFPQERLPSFLRPVETDIETRVSDEYAGFLRVRRTAFFSTLVVTVFAVALGLSGSWAAAGGLAVVVLAPLLVFLIGTQVAVMLARRRQL